MITIKYTTVKGNKHLYNLTIENDRGGIRVQMLCNLSDVQQLLGDVARVYNNIKRQESE